MAFVIAVIGWLAAFEAATAARAAIGTPMDNAAMALLSGGSARPLGDVDANVLVFFRPNQEHSREGLRELAACQKALAGKPVYWAAVISSSAPAQAAAALVRESGFAAPVLVDEGDALYGSLGIALHPVVIIAGRDHKLAAFEPFRSVNYCPVVSARVRRLLGEINDEELRDALDPPKSSEGGNGQVARRYLALAQTLFKAGNYDKALENARRSVERDAALAPAHALIGEILDAQGNCSDAIAAFNKALAIDGASVAATQGIQRCKSRQ